jgi:phosphohistidine phosphatase SixA
MPRTATLLLLLTLVAVDAVGQPAVFIVRHAERADAGKTGGSMMADDPDLSPTGRKRAQSLAAMLRDAGIRAVYTTELKRTRQTAAPLVDALRVTARTVPAADVNTLVQNVNGETGDVLIVGHSNTIPKILAALGITETVTIDDAEYDHMFIVIRSTPARLLRLRYR